MTDIYTLRSQVDMLPTIKGRAGLMHKIDKNIVFLRAHKGSHSLIDSLHRECYEEYLQLEKIAKDKAAELLKSRRPTLPWSVKNYKPGW